MPSFEVWTSGHNEDSEWKLALETGSYTDAVRTAEELLAQNQEVYITEEAELEVNDKPLHEHLLIFWTESLYDYTGCKPVGRGFGYSQESQRLTTYRVRARSPKLPERAQSLFDQAASVVAREGRASTSLIQRHLNIGYTQAAQLIEQMEKEGIISPPSHLGKREVLVPAQLTVAVGPRLPNQEPIRRPPVVVSVQEQNLEEAEYANMPCDRCSSIFPFHAMEWHSHEVKAGSTTGVRRSSSSTGFRSNVHSGSVVQRRGTSYTSGRTYYRNESLLLCRGCLKVVKSQDRARNAIRFVSWLFK